VSKKWVLDKKMRHDEKLREKYLHLRNSFSVEDKEVARAMAEAENPYHDKFFGIIKPSKKKTFCRGGGS
jgi:hypothetical protein